MSDKHSSLSNPETISTLNELEVARRRAEINASQDRLLLVTNLTTLREEGPGVVFKNVLLPVVGVGVAIWGVSKIVGSLTRSDDRAYYLEPNDDELDLSQANGNRPYLESRSQQVPKPTRRVSMHDSLSTASKFIPAALIIAKMGIGYWEKSGRRVPQVLHDLVAGPGVSSSQTK